MRRVLPYIAFLLAAAVIAGALYEVNSRSEDDQLAVEPTLMPVPSVPVPTAAAEESPTVAPTGSGSASPAATETLTPSLQATEEPQAQAVNPTPEPPQTPTPSPSSSPAARVVTGQRSPDTGGGALPAGLAFITLVVLIRVLDGMRRRHTGGRATPP